MISDRRKSTESTHSYKYSPKHSAGLDVGAAGSGGGGGRKKSVRSRFDSCSEALCSDDRQLQQQQQQHDESEEDDMQLRNILLQSRNDLDKTQELRVHSSHMLTPEDYVSLPSTSFPIVTSGFIVLASSAVVVGIKMKSFIPVLYFVLFLLLLLLIIRVLKCGWPLF